MIIDWYKKTGDIIEERLDDFLSKFYPKSAQLPLGNGVRLNPCPSCGHNDCCTFSNGMVWCFSCEWKGSYTSAYISLAETQGRGKGQAMHDIAEFTGIALPNIDSEEYLKESRIADIRKIAADIYHSNLMNSEERFPHPKKQGTTTALDYLEYERKRKRETLKAFRVGLAVDYFFLRDILLKEGFTKDEIKEANLNIPKGLLVYPQWCPFSRNVLRFNCKNPFKIELTDSNGNTYAPPGWSGGSRDKGFGFSPAFSFKNPIILVEGENDAAALYEHGGDKGLNVSWLSGNPKPDHFEIFKNSKAPIYLMMDNDEKGDKYVEMINDLIPDKPVYKVNYDSNFGDPDDYYKMHSSPLRMDELMAHADELKTNNSRISQDGRLWEIATRNERLTFSLSYVDERKGIVGDAKLYKKGVLSDTRTAVTLTQLPAAFKPISLHLNEKIEEYYNASGDADSKSIEDLCEIFVFSKYRKSVSKEIARKIHEANYSNDEKDKIADTVRGIIGQDAFDEVLKDMNDIQNKAVIENLNAIPTMKLSHFFSITNGDAYFYFTDVKSDADSVKRIPYFLRNDGETIRLDLLKKKDEQCLLLVDNKYELQQEVDVAKIKVSETSLTHEWAKKFKSGEMTDDDTNPYNLVKKIEGYIRRFYFHTDENVYKVIALYIYGTYYYEMFGQYPYLFLNGEKGSGKTILDIVIYMFALNARLAIHMSEAAMYRMISIDGGTIILDEIEYMTSRKSTQDNTMATILKGGYQRSGAAYRVNMDTASAEGFDIFCPKVISNINGVEDVIEDRCIRIDTYRMKIRKDFKMEDPKYFLQEKLDEIKGVTSRCVCSALSHFKTLHDFYQASHMVTNNARLTQLLTPILALARFVDASKKYKDLKDFDVAHAATSDSGEYTSSFIEYYESNIARVKNDIEGGTPEGVLKQIISRIAHELVGHIDDSSIDYIIPEDHRYRNKITYDVNTGDFIVDAIHLKVFMEEAIHEHLDMTDVSRTVKAVFSNVREKRKTVKLEGSTDELIREFSGMPQLKVRAYTFNVKDLIPSLSTFDDEDSHISDPDLKDPF